MTQSSHLDSMTKKIIDVASQAGARIMEIYAGETEIKLKEDRSPLTMADLRSHEYIVARLHTHTPDIPVVSEEAESSHQDLVSGRDRFWLVDPLDGTKEFLKKTGDFTVNIALIERGESILGVVHVPARGITYFAEKGQSAWRQVNASEPVRIQTSPVAPDRLRIVASKDHAGPEVEALLRRLPNAEITSIGSSLKFCLVAEGKADFYPRFVPTMEWDTAAAQCIVEVAGGAVQTLDGARLTYGKPDCRNPSIVTIGTPAFAWRNLITE